MIEIENKYRISKKVFISLINNAINKRKHSVKAIEQYYLFKENAQIFYDNVNFKFTIVLIDKFQNHKAHLDVFVDSINEREKINELLGDVGANYNLLEDKGTYRIRFLNGSPIFTMKKKQKNVSGTFEFEYCLNRSIESARSGLNFIDCIKDVDSCIVKIRHLIQKGHYTYELDDYQDFDFYTLEIEFKNEEEQLNFEPDFEFLADETNNSEMKNKNMAKSLLKKD